MFNISDISEKNKLKSTSREIHRLILHIGEKEMALDCYHHGREKCWRVSVRGYDDMKFDRYNRNIQQTYPNSIVIKIWRLKTIVDVLNNLDGRVENSISYSSNNHRFLQCILRCIFEGGQ